MNHDESLTMSPALLSDAQAATGWATTPESVLQFAGPGLSHPLSAQAILDSVDSGWRVMALRSGETPVGLGSFVIREVGATHLGRLIVDPTLRGRGLGRTLVTRLIDHVSALPGVKAITLNVYETNAQAHSLYASLGLETTERLPAPSPDGWPSLRMRRPADL